MYATSYYSLPVQREFSSRKRITDDREESEQYTQIKMKEQRVSCRLNINFDYAFILFLTKVLKL